MLARPNRTHQEISRSLDEFAKSDEVLLSPALMCRYSGNWVAVFRGRIVAVAPELDIIRDKIHREKIPLGTVAIRFIEKEGMAAI